MQHSIPASEPHLEPQLVFYKVGMIISSSQSCSRVERGSGRNRCLAENGSQKGYRPHLTRGGLDEVPPYLPWL